MKVSFTIVMLFFAITANATNYYVNPSSDSLTEKGTLIRPWKSLGILNSAMRFLKPGDSVFFKKGELFFGYLDIKCTGLPKAPIVFTTYGQAAAIPVFLYTADDPAVTSADNDKAPRERVTVSIKKSNYVVIDGIEITDDGMRTEDHTMQARVKTGIAIEQSNNIIVKNTKISLVGTGFNINGDNNLVEKCRLENLRMIINTVGGDDDYGADAVVVSGRGNRIQNCYFQDCWAKTFDYGYGGNVIKIFGSGSDSNKVVGNTAINCNSFLEFGSNDGGAASNNLISRNTLINCGNLVYIHNKGTTSIKVNNLLFLENTVLQNVIQFNMPRHLVGMASVTSNKGIIHLQNNIFWITVAMGIAAPELFAGQQVDHKSNIYYFSQSELSDTPDKSEHVLNKKSLIFSHPILNFPAFYNPDFFPFRYLLNFWLSLLT